MKNIYFEPDEEIASVIDRLVQTEINQINLVVPPAAQIWQSSINLKLLKREADNLGKEITLIIPDDLGREVAEKLGFTVKRERDFPIELIQGESMAEEEVKEKETEITPLEEDWEKESSIEKDKRDIFGLLVKELKPEKKLSSKKLFRLPGSGTKGPKKRMADIVSPVDEAEFKFFHRRPKRKPLIRREPPAEPVPEPVEKEPIIRERFSQEPRRLFLSKWPKFLIIFIGLALVVGALVGYLALPTTEVTISPKIEEISFDLLVVGSTGISRVDEILNKIPLQEVKVEKTKSKEFLATGEKEISEKARGIITVYNEYSSSPQTLVATTRFESSEGKVFRINKNIIIPGAKIEEGKIIPSSIRVEVVADQSGQDYNIGPTNFTIPGFKGTAKYVGFYGKSQEPMTDGFVGKVKVVLAEDLEMAKEGLIDEIKKEVRQTLDEQIPTDLKLIEGGLKEEIAEVSASAEEGDETDRFSIEIEAIARALLFKEEDLRHLVDLNLISRIPENKSPLSQSQQISWGEPIIDWVKGEASFELATTENAIWQIDTEALKKELAGQSEVEVRKYLANQPEIEKAKVTFWPFWVKRIPPQEKKIKITIEGVD